MPLLAETETTSAPDKPNILLIRVDDLGYLDLGCQGANDIKIPNIDQLAASGMRFTAGYVTAPQCGPSRAGMITGMSVPQHVFSNLNENPKELAEKALKNPEQKQMLSTRLDAWLTQLEENAKTLTPKH
jgi:arylsulfatase A-like enzyme